MTNVTWLDTAAQRDWQRQESDIEALAEKMLPAVYAHGACVLDTVDMAFKLATSFIYERDLRRKQRGE